MSLSFRMILEIQTHLTHPETSVHIWYVPEVLRRRNLCETHSSWNQDLKLVLEEQHWFQICYLLLKSLTMPIFLVFLLKKRCASLRNREWQLCLLAVLVNTYRLIIFKPWGSPRSLLQLFWCFFLAISWSEELIVNNLGSFFLDSLMDSSRHCNDSFWSEIYLNI